jgi:hypothetical protein|tara:strand:+ start:1327 stop:1593 length:267 start_codon:yes stop_codon:yes gene_type:complete
MSNYAAITATSQIKTSAGKINGIFVSSASSTPTITVYDSFKSSNSDPVVLATFTPTGNTNLNFYPGLYVNKGIYVVISGTVSATIAFE